MNSIQAYSSKKPGVPGASSAPGLRAIAPNELYVQGGLFLLKTIVVVGIGYYAYEKFVNRFQELKYNSNYPPANISDAQAETRAAGIYSSITLFGNSVQNVAANLKDVNYNGFVKIYNAFGKHTGTLLGGELNLVEWLNNQFDTEQMAQLRFLVPGLF